MKPATKSSTFTEKQREEIAQLIKQGMSKLKGSLSKELLLLKRLLERTAAANSIGFSPQKTPLVKTEGKESARTEAVPKFAGKQENSPKMNVANQADNNKKDHKSPAKLKSPPLSPRLSVLSRALTTA